MPLLPLPCSKLFQQLGDLGPNRRVASRRRAALELHHHVHSPQTVAELAKRLAHQPLRAVAVDRPRRYPLARDDADARLGTAVRPDEQGEMAACPGSAACQGRFVLPARQQSRAARQRGARPAQTESRARPLARRARITPRPPRVRMRTRKPCVRLRRCFDG